MSEMMQHAVVLLVVAGCASMLLRNAWALILSVAKPASAPARASSCGGCKGCGAQAALRERRLENGCRPDSLAPPRR